MPANKYIALVSGKKKEVRASVTSTPDGIVAMDATGRIDLGVLPVGVGAETIVGTASEALSAGDFVNVFNNAGALGVRKADATNTTKPAIGFVLASVANAGTATVYLISQTNISLTGLTIGSDYYLATTPGAMTITAPSTAGNIVQYIGRASKTTEIVFSELDYIEVA